MKLRFYAAGDTLVPERNTDGSAMPRAAVGSPSRYYGREYVAALIPPASKSPVEIDSETGEAQYLRRCARDHEVFPVDEATAKFCGVSLQAVEHINGEWRVKAPPAEAKKGGS